MNRRSWAQCGLAGVGFATALAAHGAAPVDAWRTLIERYAQRQPGNASLRIEIDVAPDETGPPPCQRPIRVVDTIRSRGLGPISMTLQCDSPAWRWSVNVRVRGMGNVVRASRPLPAGSPLGPDDLQLVEADLGSEPAGVATDLAQALGRETVRPISENATLALNALRAATVIRQGDRVTVRVVGSTFHVSADGTAQQAGGVGESIRVKLPDGKVVAASVVRAGHVDMKL